MYALSDMPQPDATEWPEEICRVKCAELAKRIVPRMLHECNRHATDEVEDMLACMQFGPIDYRDIKCINVAHGHLQRIFASYEKQLGDTFVSSQVMPKLIMRMLRQCADIMNTTLAGRPDGLQARTTVVVGDDLTLRI